MDEAVREVTNAVLGHDGACLPGRENNPDFVEVSLVGLVCRCHLSFGFETMRVLHSPSRSSIIRDLPQSVFG